MTFTKSDNACFVVLHIGEIILAFGNYHKSTAMFLNTQAAAPQAVSFSKHNKIRISIAATYGFIVTFFRNVVNIEVKM